MKMRSLSALLVLAVVAGGAMAGETVRVATQEAAPVPADAAHRALGPSPGALTDVDVARRARSAVDMPACSTCH